MNIVCFHNPDEDNGYLSNWYPSSFTVDGVAFSSMEQFMMYRKAICFGDEAVAAQILSTSDVAKIKSLGRQVSNYDESMWNGIRQIVVYEGLLAKFSQNEELKAKLKVTGNAVLAECAVKDRIWGIGLSMKDPDRLNKAKWNGQNLLGYALMMVRERLQQDYSWEQRKLGELALFNPKDELPQTFEYVDLESVVGTEMLSHRTEVKSSAPSRAQRLANTGDLFYQTVRPYQKNNYLFEKPDNNYVFSTGYAQMRPYVDGYFLLSLVQSERFVKVVLDNCTGTSYPAINANDLAEIEVAAPSDESEAQKIGAIFRSIDNLITLHQRELEKLQNIKKSMLEKMFVQEEKRK